MSIEEKASEFVRKMKEAYDKYESYVDWHDVELAYMQGAHDAMDSNFNKEVVKNVSNEY